MPTVYATANMAARSVLNNYARGRTLLFTISYKF